MAQSKLNQRSRLCGVIAYIEAIALFAYCGLLAVTALNSTGATVSAPVVEITIFVIFAIGILLVARGMWARSLNARAPYFLTQVFVLIVAYTVFVGDGSVVKLIGALIGVIGLLGLAFGIAMILADETGTDESQSGPTDSGESVKSD